MPAPGSRSNTRRVCFFLNSWTFGGVEQHVVVLCSHLAAFGYEPLVVCERLAALEPLYQRLNEVGIEPHFFEAGPTATAKARETWRLSRWLRAQRVDILHVQLVSTGGGRSPLLAGKLADIPMVVTHHAAPRAPQPALTRLARSPLIAMAERFVAVSHANRTAQIRYMGLRPERIQAIQNGVDVADVAPDRSAAHARLTAALGLASRAKLVGGAGRLCEQKGFAALLSATPQLLRREPETHVVLIGDGPLRGELETQARRLGIAVRVHFLGFRDDVPALLAALDVLVMPSLFEGLPLVLLEALAAGCPVVAHAVDGIPEVLEDQRMGFLVSVGDVATLADRTARLLGEPALAQSMSLAARQTALKRLTAERMARQTAAVYDGVLRRSSRVLEKLD